VRVEELDVSRVQEWTDGSRIEGRAAAATRTKGEYMGTMATVADAEELGVSLAWEVGLGTRRLETRQGLGLETSRG